MKTLFSSRNQSNLIAAFFISEIQEKKQYTLWETETMYPAFSTICGMHGVRRSAQLRLKNQRQGGVIFGESGWLYVLGIIITLVLWRNSFRN